MERLGIYPIVDLVSHEIVRGGFITHVVPLDLSALARWPVDGICMEIFNSCNVC